MKQKMKCENCGSTNVSEALYENPDINWDSYEVQPKNLNSREKEYILTCNECGYITHFRR